MIGVHPKARCSAYDGLDAELKDTIRRQMGAWLPGPGRVLRRALAEGIATIAAAFAPEPVIVRLSDFKSNEYANLIGGRLSTSRSRRTRMLGFRGASRYVDESFRPCFEFRVPRR